MKVVSVLFSGSHQLYDYLCPFDVKVGDNVVVGTHRGDVPVVVAAIKDHSDRATAQVKRVITAGANDIPSEDGDDPD